MATNEGVTNGTANDGTLDCGRRSAEYSEEYFDPISTYNISLVITQHVV